MFRRISRLIVLMAVIVLIPVVLHAAPIGRISHLEGAADLTGEDGKTIPVKLADPVSRGDVLRTKGATKLEVAFNDGNTLWLAEKTRLKITQYQNVEGKKNYFDLFRGKTRTVVNSLAKKSSLEIHTPTAVCGVRGTIIIGYFSNGMSGFAFERGHGYGYNRQRPTQVVAIGTGQVMQVTNAKAAPVVRPATADEIGQHVKETSSSPDSDKQKEGEKPADGEKGGGSDKGQTDKLEQVKEKVEEKMADNLPPTVPDTLPDPVLGESSGSDPQLLQPTLMESPIADVQLPEDLYIERPVVPPPVATGNITEQPVVSGSFTGVFSSGFEDGADSGVMTLSGTGALNASDAISMANGTFTDGSAYKAYLASSVGSWRGVFTGLLLKGSALSILSGDILGAYENSTLDASGVLTRSPGYTAAGVFQSFGDLPLLVLENVSMDGNFSAPVVSGAVHGYQTSTGGILGIWGVATRADGDSGWYCNPDHETNKTISLYHYNYTPDSETTTLIDHFAYGNAEIADDLLGHVAVKGSDSLYYLDRDYLGTLSLDYRGVYHDLQTDGRYRYDSAGTGIYKLAPLAWSGDWGAEQEGYYASGSLYGIYPDSYAEDSSLELVAHEVGLAGGLDPFWTGASHLVAIGYTTDSEYQPVNGSSVEGPLLWNSSLVAEAKTGSGDRAAALFVPDAEFAGVTAGIWKDGLMDGSLYAIYKTAAGEAGWLQGVLDGSYDSSLGVWKVEGDLSRNVKVSAASNYDLSDFDVYHDFAWGVLGGGFASGQGTIANNHSLLRTTFFGKALYDENSEEEMVIPLRWGVYDLLTKDGNTYAGKPAGDSPWSARTGGMGPTQMAAPFFYQADITGTWKEDGTIDGSLSGKYMTPLYMGVMSGPFTGIYDSEGGWGGQSVGTYHVTDKLAHSAVFGNDLDEGGYFQGVEGIYRNDGGQFDHSGYISGIMGGLDDPWSGTTAFSAMGIFSTCAYGTENPGSYLLSLPLNGKKPVELTETPTAGGTYSGYLSGLIREEGYAAAIRSLYLTPTDTEGRSAAGFLSGDNLAGSISLLARESDEDDGDVTTTGIWESAASSSLLTASEPLAAGLDPETTTLGTGGMTGMVAGTFTGGMGSISGNVSEGELLYFVSAGEQLPFGVYDLKFGSGGLFTGKPAAAANWQGKVGGVFTAGEILPTSATNTVPGYWLAGIDGEWNASGEIIGTASGTWLTSTHIGSIAGPLYGLYTDGDGGGSWMAESIGAWQGEKLKFVNGIYSHTYWTDETLERVTEYNGYMGGTASLWGAGAVPFTVMGSYLHDEPSAVWKDLDVNGAGFAEGAAPLNGSAAGYYRGYMGGVMRPSATDDSLSGLAALLYMDANGNAGWMKGEMAGYGYPGVGIFRMDGELVKRQMTSTAGISPADFASSLWSNGYASGDFKGGFGAAGFIDDSEYSLYAQMLSLADYATSIAQPWGIYEFSLGGNFANPDNSASWGARMGGDGYFGAYRFVDGAGTASLNNDAGYWMAEVAAGVWQDGKITADLAGEFVSYNKYGTISGELLGAYETTGAWEAVSTGAWSGSPTDFGGSWSHSVLYDDGGRLGIGSDDNEGVFGFVRRADNNYDLIAIGEYRNADSANAGFGAPCVWSGSLDYWRGNSTNEGRSLSAFIGGTASGGAATDAYSGGMNGYAAALYYTPAGAGIIEGPLAGNYYELLYDATDAEVSGVWKVKNDPAAGLGVIDMGAFLPEDFDGMTAVIESDNSFTAGMDGGFVSGQANVGAFSGASSSGETMFVTTQSGGNSESLPFGIYNIRMGNSDKPGYYEGKPQTASVDYRTRAGGTGHFGYSDIPGYWLADVTGVWDENAIGQGTIDGSLSGWYLTPYYMGTIDGKVFGLYTEDGVAEGNGSWIASSVGSWQGEKLAVWSDLNVSGGAFMFTRYDGENPTHGWDDASSMQGLMGSRELPWGATHSFVALGKYTNPDDRRLWWVWTPGNWESRGADGSAILGDMMGVNRPDNSSDGFYHALFLRPDGEGGHKAGYLGYSLTGQTYPDLGFHVGASSGMWELAATRSKFYEEPFDIGEDNLDSFNWDSDLLTDVSLVGAAAGAIGVDNFTARKTSIGDLNWGVWSTTMADGLAILPGAEWSATAGGYFGNTSLPGYWLAALGGAAWTDSNVNGTISYRYINGTAMGEFAGSLFGAYKYNDETGLYDWQAAAGGVYGGGETGAWESPLAYATSFTFEPETLGHYDPEDSTSPVVVSTEGASMSGLMGGDENLWNASDANTAATLIMGAQTQFSSVGSYWWGEIVSRNYSDGSAETYLGGAYKGYLGGVRTGDVLDARLIALYLDPDGGVGYIRGQFAGRTYPEIGMFELEGGIYPTEVSGVSVVSDLASSVWAKDFSAADRLVGSFGPAGLLKGGNPDYLSGWYYGDPIFGSNQNMSTMSLINREGEKTENWGIFRLSQTGVFTLPETGSGEWSAKSGGSGYFGACNVLYSEVGGYTGTDNFGYWLMDTAGGGVDSDRFTAALNGRFITGTAMGDAAATTGALAGTGISGNLLGNMDSTDGLWQMVSLGTWSGKDLSHVAPATTTETTVVSRHFTGSYAYQDGGQYSYGYYSDDHSGSISYFRPPTAEDPDGVNYSISYAADGTYSKYDGNSGQTEAGRWDDGNESLAFLATPLDGADGPVIYYPLTESLDVRQEGSLGDALLGGVETLWSATKDAPAAVTMIGRYAPTFAASTTWSTKVTSSDYTSGAGMTYDAGAYGGYLVGDTLGVNVSSRFLGLYINPEGDAGVLRGSLNGALYPEIGMFAMDGRMYPETPIIEAGVVLPSEFAGNVVETVGGTSQKMAASFGADGKIGADHLSLETMSFLADNAPYGMPWGIYRQYLAGRFEPATSGVSWSGVTGGWQTFGTAESLPSGGHDDDGYWLADISSGIWENGRFSGNLVGRYITGTRLGSGTYGGLSGDLFGVYNASDNTWQGFGLGAWSGAELSFVSDIYSVSSGYASSSLDMLLGGVDSLWSGAAVPVVGIGVYGGTERLWNWPLHSWNFKNSTATTYDQGAYRGFGSQVMDGAGSISGGIISLYLDNAGKTGYLYGTFTGDTYPSIGMFALDGALKSLEMESAATGLLPDNFYASIMETGFRSLSVYGLVEPTITMMQENEMGIIDANPTWAIWQSLVEGSYTVPSPDHWSWSAQTSTEVHWGNYYDVTWDAAKATLAGQSAGAKVDWASATTWVNGGSIKGVFDPTAATWRSIAQGAMMDTATFMTRIDAIKNDSAKLQEFFNATKIPCFQVGSTDLRGGGSVIGGTIDLGSAADAAKGILNATFLAPSTGARPQIWASGLVNGAYTGTPSGGTVNLQGFAPGSTGATTNGITANFNVQQFGTTAGSNWGATVTSGNVPSNSLTGAQGFTTTNSAVFQGGAAGKITAVPTASPGAFTGSAAGTVSTP